MKRRDLLHLITLTGVSNLCGCSWQPLRSITHLLHEADDQGGGQDIAEIQTPSDVAKKKLAPGQMTDELAKDVRAKSIHFVEDFPDDIHFSGRKMELIQTLTKKLRAVQRHVGYGNFNVLGMDDFIRYAKYAKGSSEITAEEKLFLEEMFFFDAKKYGFQGEKVVLKMTDTINMNLVEKMAGTGHYLRKGEPLETYNKIIKDVGDSVVLTSGVRGLAKQYHLFFEKALETKGNMSKASRSLAPPGYSFHGQGDFDIGKRGFGLRNFTEKFASTDEYKKLVDSGFVQIRYTESNLLGVRFEPWHIKVHV